MIVFIYMTGKLKQLLSDPISIMISDFIIDYYFYDEKLKTSKIIYYIL